MRAEAVTTGRHLREQRVALASFASVTVLIIVFLLRDASAFVNSAQDELIGHLGASGGFTLAASGTYLVLRRQRPNLLTILIAGAAVTVGAELAQGLAPSRGIELRDIAAGFGGVLIAAVGIEVILLLFSLLTAQRIHTIVSAIAALILLVLLVIGFAPDTVSGASPDGESCPFTTIDGSGQRITIGADPAIENGCLETAAGGLGLFALDGASTSNDDSVLVSSPLDQLADRLDETRRLVVTAEFTSGEFSDEVRQPGVLLILRSDEAGDLLQIRTRDQNAQVIGPRVVSPYAALSYSEVFEPATRYVLRTELTASELRVFVDDELVATTGVDPGWLDTFAEADGAQDLTLYIGNTPSVIRPFRGVVEWIEINT